MADAPSALVAARAALASGTVGALVSDLGGVLRHLDPALLDALDRDLSLPRGSVLTAILGNPFLGEVIRGRGTFAQWRERAVSDLIAAGAAVDTAHTAVERWASSAAEVDHDIAELLRKASQPGVPTFIFTNGTDRVPDELAALGLGDLTGSSGERLLNTVDFGEAKPHRATYAAAHRRIEEVFDRPIPASGVLFLDDSAADVEGARAFGWEALHYAR